MNIWLTFKTLMLLTTFLAPTVSATHDYDTEDIQQLVIAEAKRQNLAPSLALAIAKVESNFNPNALSHAGAKGVMQIMPRTAEQTFGVPRARLFEPDVNIKLGVRFIKQLLERYDNRLEIALSHYNGGSGVKNRDGELSVMPATRSYVNKVLNTQQDYLPDDNKKQFSWQVNQLDIDAINVDTDSTQTAPQIESLRALRLHNITRNFQDKGGNSFNNKPAHFEKQRLKSVSLKSKIAKVRQWESIYED